MIKCICQARIYILQRRENIRETVRNIVLHVSFFVTAGRKLLTDERERTNEKYQDSGCEYFYDSAGNRIKRICG